MDAVQDVFDFLAAEGLAGGATGWTLLRRRVTDAPAGDQLVVVTEDGGVAPEQPANTGIGDTATMDPGVQVRTRGAPWDGDASAAKARAIFDALHGLRAQTVGSTTYHRVGALTSAPVFIGYDEQNRPEHTISFRLLAPINA